MDPCRPRQGRHRSVRPDDRARYLTLSLIPALLDDLLHVNGAGQAINYGLDKARFPAPVPVGSRVRLKAVVERSIPCPRDSNLRSLSPSSATL
jgi:MaoC like domain